MTTARPRNEAYIWVTWLAPLLAGTNACLWATWFRAHYYFRRVSSFDDPTWQIEHDAMVIAARDSLRADDFQITAEGENKFSLTSSGITLAGKPDLIAIRPDRALAIDCKSGAPRPAHRAQLMVYMAVLPCVRPELRGRTIEGMIQYPDEETYIPAAAIDAAFHQELRTLIHMVGGPTPPTRLPSAGECRFCSIGSRDCPDRIETLEPVAVTDHGLF